MLLLPGVSSCTQAWADFFRSDHAAFVEEAAAAAAGGDEATLSALREELQARVWKAHTRTIDGGVLASQELLDALPAGERAFGLGWTRMVELLASVNWSTSLATLQRDGIGFLPARCIEKGVLDDMRISAPNELAAVIASQRLGALPLPLLQLSAAFWRRVARWRSARQRMPATLAKLTYGKKRALPPVLARLALLAILPKSVAEVAAWLALVFAWLRYA